MVSYTPTVLHIIFHIFFQPIQPVNRRIVERVRIVLVYVADVGVDVHGGIKICSASLNVTSLGNSAFSAHFIKAFTLSSS